MTMLPSTRITGFALAALAAAMLAGALAFQYLGGLPPCPLCHWQRWAWIAAGPAALLAGLVGGTHPPAGRALLGLAAVATLAGAVVAGFHVGVEAGWWEGTAACSGAVYEPGLSPAELRERLLSAPVVRCDAVPWSLLGVSMAGYNGIVATLAGLAALAVAIRNGRRA